MKNDELYNIARDALNESELKSEDIPNIDLYVDQIINIVSAKLALGSERFYDRQLTKTMINNYSKDGLITPIKGKKYSKEQILQILTIYTLKGALSINEIKRMLSGLYSTEDFDEIKLKEIYDRHMDIKTVNKEYAVAALDGIVERNSLDLNSDSDYINTVFALAALSSQLKNMAQAMIDARFPEPVEKDEQEKEKREKEEKKKEKEEKKKEKEREKDKKKESSDAENN